jgi:hypothetical protein
MIAPISYSSNIYPVGNIASNYLAVNSINKVGAIRPLSSHGTQSTDNIKPLECQSCNNRKYVDQSNEGNVSFQTPSHISPNSSYAKVSAHEQEHVTNAIQEGKQVGTELISSSVTLKMDVCSECGTPYVSGGLTTTQMKYNERNPYEASRKAIEGSVLKGMHVDYVA